MSRASARTGGPAAIRGRVAVAVYLALAAAAVIAGWFAIANRPHPTSLVELAAIDVEYAVLVRDVAGDPDRSFTSLFHIERGEVWGALVPRVSMPAGVRSAVVATAGVVAVHVQSGERVDLMAFDAARGEKLGRVTVADPAVDGSGLAHAGSVAGDDGTVFELVLRAEGSVVMAIDMHHGTIRWRSELDQVHRPAHAWLRGQHLLVYVQDRLHILDRATGLPAAGAEGGVALAPVPCVLDDRVYGVRDGVLHAVSLPGGDAGGDAGVHTRPLPGASPHMLLGVCGRHGKRDVLLTLRPYRHGASNGDGGGGAIVAVDRDTDATAWTLDLAHSPTLEHLSQLTGPETASLAGALPRYAPVLLKDGFAGILAMLDLERGEIAWQSRPASELLNATLVRMPGQPERWPDAWLATSRHLAVLDGNTGALRAAVAPDGFPLSWPRHLPDGRLWIRDHERWGVLDGNSLAVVPSAGTLTVQPDERKVLIDRLELPPAAR